MPGSGGHYYPEHLPILGEQGNYCLFYWYSILFNLSVVCMYIYMPLTALFLEVFLVNRLLFSMHIVSLE